MNNLKKYLKFFIFLLCVGFITYKLNDSTELLREKTLNISDIYFIFIISLIFFNIISFRAFLLIKYSTRYSYSYLDWSRLHFESLILNSVIPLSGIVYKAVNLKKRHVNYTQFLAVSYLLVGSYISITLVLVLLELLLLLKFYSMIFIIIAGTLIFTILFSPVILEKFIKFFMKLKILDKYLGSLYNLIEILKKILIKKYLLIILSLNTMVVHLFEIIIFYLICVFFIDNINLHIVITLFAASYVIDRIPFVSEIPGASEIIIGTIGVPFGIYFIDGVIIKLSIRFLNYLSVLLNGGIYFALSVIDKNKFIN